MLKNLATGFFLSLFLIFPLACGRVVEEAPASPVYTNAPFDATKITTEEVTIGTTTITREIVSNQVIVEAAGGVDESSIRAKLPAGYEIIGKNTSANTYQVRIPTGESVSTAITTLGSVQGVSNAGINPVVTVCITPNDDSFQSNWSTDRWGFVSIEAKSAWDLAQGSSNVILAVVDTGLDLDHSDFSGRVDTAHKQNFAAGTLDPEDDSGHGTAVAGIAAATGNNAKYIAGMDWKSKIMALKAQDMTGKGDGFTAANAICYAAAQGAKVINCSFGIYLDENNSKDKAMVKHFEKAAEFCVDYGTLVVAAAGNENRDASNFYPAALSNYTNTTFVAVGGIGINGGRWIESTTEASNYGSTVNISAPANKIYTTWFDGAVQSNKKGTSLAAPFVSGTASLILSIPEVSVSVYGLRNSILEGSDALSTDKAIGVKLNTWKAILRALYYSNKSVASISSDPAGATIYLDGTNTGKVTTSEGTTRMVVSPGSHTIKLTLSGYQDKEQTVTFTKGEEQIISGSLTPIAPTTTTTTTTTSSTTTTSTTTSTTSTTVAGNMITGEASSSLTVNNGNFWIRTDYTSSSTRNILNQIGLSGQGGWLNRALYPSPCLTQSSTFFDGVKDRSLSILKNTTDIAAYQSQFTAYSGSKELRVTWKFIVPKDKKYAIWVASFESIGANKNITVDNPDGYYVQDVYFCYPIQPTPEAGTSVSWEGVSAAVNWQYATAYDEYSSSNRYFSIYNSNGCFTFGYFGSSCSTLPYFLPYLNTEMTYKSIFTTIKKVTLSVSSPNAQWVGVLAFHDNIADAASLYTDALSNLSTYLSML